MMNQLPLLVEMDMQWLRENPYPGRGIVQGVAESGEVVQIYWIMGRSENSRNRVLSVDGNRVFTEPADPAKLTDPKLIIYNAMQGGLRISVVSNGSQTDAVFLRMSDYLKNIATALVGYQYEPDEPNFTPRITAVYDGMSSGEFAFSILRKSVHDKSCDQFFYYYKTIESGYGYCITTYRGDSNNGEPLPSFAGEPFLVPLRGDIEEIANTFWQALNEENRVSLAVKFILPSGKKSGIKVINKYQKV